MIINFSTNLQSANPAYLKECFPNSKGSRIFLRVPLSQKRLLVSTEPNRKFELVLKMKQSRTRVTRSSPWYWELGLRLGSILAPCTCWAKPSVLALPYLLCPNTSNPKPCSHLSHQTHHILQGCISAFISLTGLSSLRLATARYSHLCTLSTEVGVRSRHSINEYMPS